jgi:hypothetical protein
MKLGSCHRALGLGLLAIAIANATFTIAQTSPLVEVTVVDADNGQAIPRAKVILYDGAQPASDTEVSAFADREAFGVAPGARVIPAGPSRPSRSLETNDLGKVIFAELKAGTYRLDAEGDGYVPQRRQHVPGVVAGGILINVSGGDKTTVQVRLKRAATIAGTVKNSSDEPMADFSVFLLQPVFSRTGERGFAARIGTTTDQSGRFTIAGLEQGRYYVATGRARRVRNIRGSDPPELYQFSYYPGVSDPDVASHIDVGPGSRFDGVDLIVQKEKLYRVRGRIDFGPQPPPVPFLTLFGFARPFDIPGSGRRVELGIPEISRDGRFEINHLPSGTYALEVNVDRSAPRQLGPQTSTSADGVFPLELKDRDIDDLELRMVAGTSIRGHVRVADGSPLSSIGTSFGRLQVGFDPATQIQPGGFSLINMNDGSFNVKGVYGTYHVSMPITQGAYISEIRVNGEPARPPMITIPNGFAGEVALVVRLNGGSIAGRVVDERSQSAAAAKSGLVLEEPLQFPSGFRAQFTTRADGTFSVNSVPPGNYRVYVWDGIDQFSIFDPNLLRQSSTLATPVRVSERAQAFAEVRVIRPR